MDNVIEALSQLGGLVGEKMCEYPHVSSTVLAAFMLGIAVSIVVRFARS